MINVYRVLVHAKHVILIVVVRYVYYLIVKLLSLKVVPVSFVLIHIVWIVIILVLAVAIPVLKDIYCLMAHVLIHVYLDVQYALILPHVLHVSITTIYPIQLVLDVLMLHHAKYVVKQLHLSVLHVLKDISYNLLLIHVVNANLIVKYVHHRLNALLYIKHKDIL